MNSDIARASAAYMGELTAAQVIVAAEWIMEGDGHNPVRLYLQRDGSVDVYQDPSHTNIGPDGLHQ